MFRGANRSKQSPSSQLLNNASCVRMVYHGVFVRALNKPTSNRVGGGVGFGSGSIPAFCQRLLADPQAVGSLYLRSSMLCLNGILL